MVSVTATPATLTEPPHRDERMERLFAPLGWSHFLSQHWQQRFVHLQRDPIQGFGDLPGFEDVDFLIAAHGGRADFPISVIGSHLDRGVPEELRSSHPAHWTPAKVYERLAQGATVRIGNMARYFPAVNDLAVLFESQLQTDAHINLYLTPRRARAFAAHFDNHDVFIMQLAGRKRWQLFEQAEQWPLEVVYRGRLDWLRQLQDSATAYPPARGGELQADRVLTAGDLLYVPRGQVHQVHTLDDEPSLHLTIATPVVTWYEVCVQALRGASMLTPDLRATVPVDFATRPQAVDEACLDTVIAALRDSLDTTLLRATLATMGRDFIRSRRGHWRGTATSIEASGEVKSNSVLRVRPALLYHVHREPAQLLLSFWGRVIPIPIRCESMLDHVLMHQVFRPCELPTHLGEQSRLVFTQALVQQGFIELAGG